MEGVVVDDDRRRRKVERMGWSGFGENAVGERKEDVGLFLEKRRMDIALEWRKQLRYRGKR